MFNRRCMSTMCNHLLQCLKLTQKMGKGKLVHLSWYKRKEEYGAKNSARY